MIEYFFTCPYCWERISMLLDEEMERNYIEDCEVCCRPIEIECKLAGERVLFFNARPIEGIK
jgi:hypothetical protein